LWVPIRPPGAQLDYFRIAGQPQLSEKRKVSHRALLGMNQAFPMFI
jgi:hypothetical protein